MSYDPKLTTFDERIIEFDEFFEDAGIDGVAI
jgi:hypothetical protein